MWGYKKLACRKTVIVNLTTGTTFKGVLYKVYGTIIILKQAQLLQNNAATDVSGDVAIERTKIEFIQIVGN